MVSGRRERIVISCVTFETVKITDPVKFYDATKVHLIHYIKDPQSENGKIYMEFCERVCELISENATVPIDIIRHMENVNDFTIMLRTVLSIIEEENKKDEPSDIFVNISAGTSEYAAAAAIASMMMPGTIPFSVSTVEYKVKDVRGTFYDLNDKPVGLTESVRDPKCLPKYSMPIPDRNVILGLRALDEMNKKKLSTKGPEVIRVLKDLDIWRREGGEVVFDNKGKVKITRSDSVYYFRDFVEKWISNGWVYRDEFKKRYFLTDEGKIVLDTFYYSPK
ncbi:hypothetical protein Mpt1_c09940 [Candidatus Methanoplasma termitum]|uniref:HFX-2341-like N-terminal domain-containing protein n=1 Tax=Candidatus Methanoplasma termitum TaxID=1577791 RepID=A0A0A7LEW0_9ARCH|nr:DUF6293 family protein [Candidatus Methanoplasma termitum]AIZ56867.1 hypothetical protein Mpt1_c09940 [Candidatus Methanoplasma termitum]